jgi:two-component system response regulator FixJ
MSRTVYVVDDNTEFLESAKWWLEGAGYDVEGFDNPRDALDVLHHPRDEACILLDVRMPGMSGLDLHDTLRQRGVTLPVIYMTGHGDVPLAVEAMRKGAVTFIEKPFVDEALESALALAFEPAARPAPADVSATPVREGDLSPSEEAFQRRFSRLTAREREVIGWVVKGKLNKVIADLLGISIKTVELHRKNAMTKLQARSVVELTKLMVTGRVA